MRVVVEAAAIRRMPSLEREPKTLSLHELNCARVRTRLTMISEYISPDHRTDRSISFRHSVTSSNSPTLHFLQEAALYVLSTHSSQDAARIFTQVHIHFSPPNHKFYTRTSYVFFNFVYLKVAYHVYHAITSYVFVRRFLVIYLTRCAAGSQAGARCQEQ
jgi:hypothetical protein